MPDEPVVVVVESDNPPAPAPEPTPEPTPDVIEIPVPIPVPVPAEVQDDRVRILEGRMTVLEAGMTELRAQCSSYAESGHEHPLPASVQALHEHLTAIEQEEEMPTQKRSGILHRRVW